MINRIIDYIKELNKNGYTIIYELDNINNYQDAVEIHFEKCIASLSYSEKVKLKFFSVNKDKLQYILVLDKMIRDYLKIGDIALEDILFQVMKITTSISVNSDIYETSSSILEHISKIFSFSSSSILFLNDDEKNLETRYINKLSTENNETGIPVKGTLAGESVLVNLPICVNDPSLHPGYITIEGFDPDSKNIMNFSCIPFTFENKSFGTLVFITTKRYFDLIDYYSFFLISQIVSSVMEVTIKEEKIKSMLMSTLNALLKAQNVRVKNDYVHENKVQELALKIAEKEKVSSEDKWILSMATYIYDIGEIGIPNSILSKKEVLTEEEKKIIRSHVELGYQLVKNIPSLPDKLKTIIHQHHERWNGEGYPTGLKGDEIDFFAQIIGLCDSYIAMTQERPYRSALPKEKALEIIRNYSGIFFNPLLVKTLCEVLE